MSKSGTAVFRNSLGGYNKNDVNSYISAMGAEMKSKEESFQMQQDRYEKDLKDLSEQNENLKKQSEELACEVFYGQQKLREEEAKRAALEKSLEELRNRADELEAELEDEKSKECPEDELNKLREKYKNAANDYYEEVMVFVSEIKNYLEGFAKEITNRSLELGSRIDLMLVSDKPELAQLTGEAEEKASEDIPAEEASEEVKEKVPEENPKPKKKASATFDEKVEHFFKSTLAAINAFKNSK